MIFNLEAVCAKNVVNGRFPVLQSKYICWRTKYRTMKKILFFAVLSLSISSQAQLGGLLKRGEKAAKAATKSEVPTEGVSSPMHQKYMGKIVFASTDTDIKKTQENEAAFLTKATLGSPIYFRVYMDNSLFNYVQKMYPKESSLIIGTHAKYKIRWFLDGAEAGFSIIQEKQFDSEEKEKWTTFKGALKSADGTYFIGTNLFPDFVKEQQAKLSMGDHKFKMEILPYMDYPETKEGAVVATGEITLTVAKNVIDANDPNVCLPTAKMTDKTIIPKIITAFKNDKLSTGAGEVKEVRVVSQKWNILTHKVTGRPLRRFVSAAIATSKNGKCAYREYDFFQDFDGVKYQDEIYLEGYSDEKEVNCKCLKP